MNNSNAAYIARRLIALCFSAIFFAFAALLGLLTMYALAHALVEPDQIASAAVKAINTAVIALAAFELGLVVSREYGDPEDGHITVVLRRTVPRFMSIVCIGLALEGLLLVIKFSQFELSGNLPYAVATVVSAAILLIALGGFLRLTRHPVEERVAVPGESPALVVEAEPAAAQMGAR